MNTLKFIKVVDNICDCIPLVSTLTNGAQLLYMLVHKVDAVANPVKTSRVDDIKIHVLTKFKSDNLRGMVPIFGNMYRLAEWIIRAKSRIFKEVLPDQFLRAIVNNNEEAVSLYLANHPLKNEEKAIKALRQSVSCSNPKVFKLILDSREWDIHAVMVALNSCWWAPNYSREANANLILDYFEDHFNNSDIEGRISRRRIGVFIDLFEDFVKADRAETASRILGILPTASRILGILPECNFELFEDVLVERSHSKEGVLTDEQVQTIINLCSTVTLKQLIHFCNRVQRRGKNHEVHEKIIQELLDKIEEGENHSEIVDAMFHVTKNGNINTRELFLEKYGDQLTVEDKLSLIKRAAPSLLFMQSVASSAAASPPYDGDSALRVLEYFFTEYNHEFSDEACIDLLQQFSEDKYEDYSLVVEKIIEIRPDLETEFNDQLEEIRVNCKDIELL